MADVAASGEAVMTGATYERAASALGDHDVRPLGPRRLKNLRESMMLYSLRPEGAPLLSSSFVDPVCRMRVAWPLAELSMDYGGERYHFCSVACRDAFAEAPELFASAAPA